MQIIILQSLTRVVQSKKEQQQEDDSVTAVARRRLSEQVAANMRAMGTSFVGRVTDVQQIAEVQIGEGVADMVEFNA